jgi:hypothetical protein
MIGGAHKLGAPSLFGVYMRLIDAVKSACQAALRDDGCRINHVEWQVIYRRKETVSEFCHIARELGYDVRDEGNGSIIIYESVDNDDLDRY